MQDTVADITKLATLCEHALLILNRYYFFPQIPQLAPFILTNPHSPLSKRSGRVLFQDDPQCFFIGIQFDGELIEAVQKQDTLFPHDLAVIAEESSHFKLLIDAVEQDRPTTRLEIEMLGEIDRFLCLLHWNATNMIPAIHAPWQNLSELCDLVFTGERFQEEDHELYQKAEGLAFKHLKKAFAHQWDATRFDFGHIHSDARAYLAQLRQQCFTK